MSTRRTTNRREFLKGRSAAEAVASAFDAAPPSRSVGATTAAEGADAAGGDIARSPDGERYLVQLSRPAMACQFAVFLNAGQYPDATEVALAALDLVERLEDQLTVYRDTSELMHINRRAAEEDVRVEPRLFGLLSRAVALSGETHGAFDITAGPLIKAWGFYRRQGSIPGDEALKEARALVGAKMLSLDTEQSTVRFARAGMELNLGAIGKGYALDRAAEVLTAAGINDFLLHGGQSSVVARGTRGGAARGWTVGLTDPLKPERRLAEITLDGRALATSGAAHQFFRHGGKRYGHILDPRSGQPAEGVFSATAVAPSASEADALSTAFYTMGVEAARSYCAARPDVGMVLLYPGRGESSVEMTTAGLEADQIRLIG